ncbi:hypothetical protein [Tumebacillus flagellatus]|uniref:Uncharacterized protein n=1 Tax=Tumebacillus flagellatus TaxID=1157490 RepID=A0A074LR81_9BACL|nr:hypothetical protein [Tumebacillus flagellatus]KEO84601.1 hypothetical protein EL26_03535 [Tumebacillus flagellatus]
MFAADNSQQKPTTEDLLYHLIGMVSQLQTDMTQVKADIQRLDHKLNVVQVEVAALREEFTEVRMSMVTKSQLASILN